MLPSSSRPADYSAVDEALKSIPDDLSVYTEESVKALMDARDAVVRDLDITKQDQVNAMAVSIEEAVLSLKEKPEEIITPDKDKTPSDSSSEENIQKDEEIQKEENPQKNDSPDTGDHSALPFWMLLLSGAVVVTIKKQKHTSK